MKARLGTGIVLLAPLVAAGGASACPLCDSDTGREVRDGIFDDRFGVNLAGVLLPAAAVGAVVGVIHFGGRRGKGG